MRRLDELRPLTSAQIDALCFLVVSIADPYDVTIDSPDDVRRLLARARIIDSGRTPADAAAALRWMADAIDPPSAARGGSGA